MKNNRNGWSAKAPVRLIVGFFRGIWGLLSHNLGLKLLSLLIAVLLWNYVVTTNTSITRTKRLNDLTGYISGQSTLSTYNRLALLDDPSEALSNIDVQVEVSQADYAKVSEDNVQVMLDVSGVRSAGTQEVPIKATTSYGRVVRISPESLKLTFEPMDSRMIPVNVQLAGDVSDARWYNINRSNPSTLTISGASSLVQSIASACVYVDVTDVEDPFVVAERYVLLDGSGNEIPQTMINCSYSSVSVSVDVYPMREIPISPEISSVVTGQPAEGYVVDSVTVQPGMITVAAENEVLDNLSELHVEPISVDGLSQSFSVRAELSTLSAFKYVSAKDVYVSVSIVEESVGAWVECGVTYINRGENLGLTASESMARVYVVGPRSAVENLQEDGFGATVDLTGLAAGTYDLQLSFPTDVYPGVTFTPEVESVTVILTNVDVSAQ